MVHGRLWNPLKMHETNTSFCRKNTYTSHISHLNLIIHCGNAVPVNTTFKFSRFFTTYGPKIAFWLRGVTSICANISFCNEFNHFLYRLMPDVGLTKRKDLSAHTFFVSVGQWLGESGDGPGANLCEAFMDDRNLRATTAATTVNGGPTEIWATTLRKCSEPIWHTPIYIYIYIYI